MQSHPALPQGVITPLVTFLTEREDIDLEATRQLVNFQVDAGVAGLLAVGSTGELGNLTSGQQQTTIQAVAEAADHRVPVWAGVAGLGTSETVLAARRAEDSGANALLVLPPLFYDVSDTELMRHFHVVASGVDLPIVAYDVPPRTPRKIPNHVLASLVRDGVLQGLKDSSGDLTAARLLLAELRDSPVAVYLGTELLIDTAVHLGCTGSVPGFANVAPAPCVAADRAARAGDWAAASRAQQKVLEIFSLVSVPMEGASFTARALSAFKLATAQATQRGTGHCATPFTSVDDAFHAAVLGIMQGQED